jgi:hypothetical protein
MDPRPVYGVVLGYYVPPAMAADSAEFGYCLFVFL